MSYLELYFVFITGCLLGVLRHVVEQYLYEQHPIACTWVNGTSQTPLAKHVLVIDWTSEALYLHS